MVNFLEQKNIAFKEALKVEKNKCKNSILQNKVIFSIYDVVIAHLIAEIKSIEVITIIADESTNFKSDSQLSISFRYIRKNIPIERFYKFIKLGEKRDAETIFLILKNYI